jgi:hypothetical protein
MKKIFTLSLIGAFIAVLFAGCSRSYGDVNESYWLSQQRGQVAYSDAYCQYMAIETPYGYTVLRVYGSYKPYEGSDVYGNFDYYGTRSFYDRSARSTFTAEVVEYDLSYYQALDAINYYCPLRAWKPNPADSIKNNK